MIRGAWAAKQERIAVAILSVVMLSFVGKLQCLDLLFGKAGIFGNIIRVKTFF